MEKMTCLRQTLSHIVLIRASISERKTRWGKGRQGNCFSQNWPFQSAHIDKKKTPSLNHGDLRRLLRLCWDLEKMFFSFNLFDEMPGFKGMFFKSNIRICTYWISITPLLWAGSYSRQLCEVYRWAAGWKGDNISSEFRTCIAYLSST